MLRIKQSLMALIVIGLLTSFTSDTPVVPASEGYVKFHIKNAGIEVDGTFKSFTVDIDHDNSNPSASTFKGSIDVGSIDTGIEMRDEHLVGEEYFDVKSYPTIDFESTRVANMTNGQIKVEGKLTIKGKTENVVLMVSMKDDPQTGQYFYHTTLELDRLDFGVGESSWVLSDDVTCKMKIAM